MKNLTKILFLILLSILFSNFTFAWDIQVVKSNTKTNSCEWAKVDEVFYISWNNKARYLYDMFWTPDDRVISKDNTKVTYWSSDDALISGCNSPTTWKRPSFLSPGNGEKVLAIWANCTFNKPTNKDKRTLQFVYNIGYYDISTSGGLFYPYTGDLYYHESYSDVANNTPKSKRYTNVGFTNLQIHDNECYNVELRYCGDGIISTEEWETCDPSDPATSGNCNVNTCKTLPTPKILVDKTDNNPSDLDGWVSDTQEVNFTDKAVFKITITNNGTEDLKDVYLIDDIPNNTVDAIKCNKTIAEVNTILEIIWNNDQILNIWESFDYSCDRENVIWDFDNQKVWYINSITVNWKWITSLIDVDYKDTTEVLIKPVPICNWLVATPDTGVNPLSSTVVCSWTKVETFKIDCWNNTLFTWTWSNYWLETFTKTCDYPLIGMYTPKCYINDSVTNYSCEDTITITENAVLSCEATTTGVQSWVISTTTTGLCKNAWETVESFASTLSWSTTNYTWACKDTSWVSHVGWNCNANYTNNTGVLSCEATTTGVQSWVISTTTTGLCKNAWETVESFASTISWTTTNYTWACKDTSWVSHVGWNCNSNYTTWWGGSGGASPQCNSISKYWNEYTCAVNKTTSDRGTVWISCDWGNVYEQVATKGNWLVQNIDGTYTAQFTCSGLEADWITTYIVNPSCNVQNGTIIANQSVGWGIVNKECKYTTPICWDWILQPKWVDNIAWTSDDEECDGWNTCNTSCKLKFTSSSSNPDCMNPSSAIYNNAVCWFTTTPTGWYVEITTVSNFAIGNWQEVFEYDTTEHKYSFKSEQTKFKETYLKMSNVWTEPIYLDNVLCIMDRWSNKEILEWHSNKYCEGNVIWWIYPDIVDPMTGNNIDNSKYFRKVGLSMKADSSEITTWETSETTKLVLTIADVSTPYGTYEWSPILSGEMFITVAKPTIVSQWGWTTYVADTSGISKISEIAKKVESKWNGVIIDTDQTNFTAVVIWNWDDLSTIDTISDTDLVDEAVNDSTKFDSDSTDIIEDSIITTIGNWDINTFVSYRWIDNVYFVKDTNIDLGDEDFDKNATYIIENGDLTISGDITSNNNINIAFIVKWWDIIIKDNVIKIKWTFITIEKNTKWWYIKANIETNNKLNVNGSIYGNLSDLTAKRTHISMDDGGNISVWTLVTFGSNIFNKPAPLVGQFIGEYMDSQKIAK
jgi:uncharacterized repeat protein (TIGR01451 family)